MMEKKISTDELLGKQCKDKITGFEGIIVGVAHHLFNCRTIGIAPQTFDKDKGKRPETEWFDEGRIEITGEGIKPEDVQAEEPGAEFGTENPRI